MVANKCEIFHQNKIFPIGVYFLLTDACNLQCEYCFAKVTRAVNSLDLSAAKKVIDNIFINAKLRKAPSVYIKFSGGGEPILQFETMCEIVAYAQELSKRLNIGIDLHLASNGQWRNNEITKWINENVNSLLISIDGIKMVQNFQRPRVDGTNSYQTIINNLRDINKDNKSLTARLTVSDKFVNKMLPNVKKMFQLGFTKVQIEPLLIMNDLPDKLSFPKRDLFIMNYLKCLKYAYKNNQTVYSSLDVLKNEVNGKHFCGHQSGNTITITPEGQVTACPEKCDQNNPLYKEFYLGYVDTTIIYDNDDNLVYQNEDLLPPSCLICECMQHCKGGCISKREFYTNEYLCDIVKKIYQAHMQLLYSKNKVAKVKYETTS